MTVVKAHRELTCHCGAKEVLAPVFVGRGLVLFYCAPCAREVVDDLGGERKPTDDCGLTASLTRCMCGSKFVVAAVSLRIGAAFGLCDRCADDLVDGFRKVLADPDRQLANQQSARATRSR